MTRGAPADTLKFIIKHFRAFVHPAVLVWNRHCAEHGCPKTHETVWPQGDHGGRLRSQSEVLYPVIHAVIELAAEHAGRKPNIICDSQGGELPGGGILLVEC